MIKNFMITDGESVYRLRCETPREIGRCFKFFLKEPGTCKWINNEVAAGDIFFDIGANIGVFTLLSANAVGKKGKVFAFEPHCGTFMQLLNNIDMNNLQSVVVACNFALGETKGFLPFNYHSSQAGTSNSQLSSVIDFSGTEYQPKFSELKYTASIDSLIAAGILPAPDCIKIDVDGSELQILKGMNRLLASPEGPRTIQVEINKPTEAEITSLMEAHNYGLSDKHYSRAVHNRIERGEGDPTNYHYNAIFQRNR